MMFLRSPKTGCRLCRKDTDGWARERGHGIALCHLPKSRWNRTHIDKAQRSHQTGIDTGGRQVLLQAVPAQVAFIDLFRLWEQSRCVKGTGPDAASAACACGAVVDHNAVSQLAVAMGRANTNAFGRCAVVAGECQTVMGILHGLEMAKYRVNVCVLVTAGIYASMTANAA